MLKVVSNGEGHELMSVPAASEEANHDAVASGSYLLNSYY
jgi:hypothetical protein